MYVYVCIHMYTYTYTYLSLNFMPRAFVCATRAFVCATRACELLIFQHDLCWTRGFVVIVIVPWLASCMRAPIKGIIRDVSWYYCRVHIRVCAKTFTMKHVAIDHKILLYYLSDTNAGNQYPPA